LTILTKSYPRAGLIGNPSDGYNGKTIAFLFSNFSVDVELYESAELNIIPGSRDKLVYTSLGDLDIDIRNYGYYGGIRLLKAVIKKFLDYCKKTDTQVPKKNFTIRYQSDIPKRLGLAGSSAIITAALKAITLFYDVTIPKPEFANLVLEAEVEELSIGAGLQDRVAQAYESPVYMDFGKKHMLKNGYGNYIPFSKTLLPDFFIAFRRDLSEGSEVIHNNLREHYNAGNHEVHKAMDRFSELTTEAYEALINKDPGKLGTLMNENFDLRKSIIQIDKKNLEMIRLARSVGASAKFTGSGGAIIGTYEDEQMYKELASILKYSNIEIIKPKIVDNGQG